MTGGLIFHKLHAQCGSQKPNLSKRSVMLIAAWLNGARHVSGCLDARAVLLRIVKIREAATFIVGLCLSESLNRTLEHKDEVPLEWGKFWCRRHQNGWGHPQTDRAVKRMVRGLHQTRQFARIDGFLFVSPLIAELSMNSPAAPGRKLTSALPHRCHAWLPHASRPTASMPSSTARRGEA